MCPLLGFVPLSGVPCFGSKLKGFVRRRFDPTTGMGVCSVNRLGQKGPSLGHFDFLSRDNS